MKHLHFRTVTLTFILIAFSICSNGQVPEMLNYQGVARDSDRNPIAATNLSIRIAILLDSPTGTVLWEEQHSNIMTSEEGIFTLKVGDPLASKSGGTLSAFADINWQLGNMYLRPSIEYQTNWYVMEASQMVSAPYALVAQKSETGQFPVNGSVVYLPDGSLAIGSDDAGGSKLAVISSDDTSEDALFEVKRADGQTVFAVYPDAVRVYVSRGDPLGKAPGSRGGFAVAGFDDNKATPINDLLWLTPDSVRFYIDDRPAGKAPGSRGGFVVAGFDDNKAPGETYMNISGRDVPDVIQASSQILFYPLKDAFLAGTIEVEDPSMVGQNSASIGYKNVASGQYSQALGYLSHATADNSMAVGNQATASGISSFAIGDNAEASGLRSYAFGYYAKALGNNDIAIGKTATANGNESLAAGFDASATGMNSVSLGAFSIAEKQGDNAIGYEAEARGIFSLAAGYQAKVLSSGYGATALGFQSSANGYRSTAIGGATTYGMYSLAAGLACKSDGDNSTTIGSFNDANSFKSIVVGSWGQANGSTNTWIDTDPIFVIGNGQSGYSNAMEVLKNGNVGIGAEPGIYKLLVAGEMQATDYITPSDLSLKTNISEISSASSKISGIDGVSFDFRIDEYPEMGLPEGTHYGVIAQDINNTLPELVRKSPNGKLAVAYTEIIPILVEAFKEQALVLDQKESRLLELEAENSDIKARLEALEVALSSMMEKQ